MTKIEQNVKSLIEPIITNLGYTIYDVIYEKEGQDNYLRIFIDKPEGTIDLNDCEKVNDAINDIPDEKDPIKSSYMLEVSSPGIEKRIRSDEHLKMFLNEKVEVHTFKNISDEIKKKEAIGILKTFDADSITIELEPEDKKASKKKKAKKQEEQDSNEDKQKEVTINKQNISAMKTVYNWED